MNNKQIFLKIKPLNPFFFGSENSFITKRKDKYGEPVTNYYAKGRTHPQQTALLGMIRHYLLVIYNKLDDISKWDIIGKNSFDGVHKDDYGKIKSISPLVIISENDEIFLPAPRTFKKNKNLKETNHEEINVHQDDGRSWQLFDQQRNLPVISNYNPKTDYLPLEWINEKKECRTIESYTRVGINIKSDRDGYYKQDFRYLEEGDAFGCWITLDEDATSRLRSVIMPFGGDGGMFEVSWKEDVDSIFIDQTPTQVLSFISDAYVKQDDMKDAEFGITKYVDFRYIKSKDTEFYRLSQDDKSHHTRLMEKGSILYFADISSSKTFADKLRINVPFRKIGYNYFKFN